jgi:hypothetical protein
VLIYNERPRIAEYLLLGFFAFALLVNSLFFLVPSSGNDPLVEYEAKPGVRRIYAASLVIDLAVISTLVVSLVRQRWTRNDQRIVATVALIAALLPWFELWYGSTFYYGEVRDKQGLPFGTNHLGVLGTFAFLSYLVLRIRVPQRMVAKERAWRMAAVVAVAAVEFIAWRFVYERWNLWQS